MQIFLKPFSMLVLCSLLVMLNACENASEINSDQEIYFNLTKLINQQAAILDSLNPKVHKKIKSGDTEETKKININNWERELYLFKNADINKTAYEGLYKKNNDVEENLVKEIYKALSDKLSTKELSITNKDDQIQGIEITLAQNNMLYSTQKHLKIQFTQLSGIGNCIKNYAIQGNQTSLFGLKTKFYITGEIEYKE